jgi:hypothetical protein
MSLRNPPPNNALAALEGEVILLRCRDCHVQFSFDGEEQLFFASKGFPAPIRCKACRKARKQAMREKPR